MKPVLIFLADGFEEIEAVTVIDVLRRADISVHTVAVSERLMVEGAHGLKIKTDATMKDIVMDEYPMIVLPGGTTGVENMRSNDDLVDFLINSKERPIAAICAAPTLLCDLKILRDCKATCYPSMANVLYNSNINVETTSVVKDKNFITSRGPATAMEFALAIVEELKGSERKIAEAEKMLVNVA